MICVIVKSDEEFIEVGNTGWCGNITQDCLAFANRDYPDEQVVIRVSSDLLQSLEYSHIKYYKQVHDPTLICINEWRRRRALL